ncbi:choice-of-anchor Q domain-containing protein [Chiayiivirga flava]|uniref:Putative outer membrane repeat protein n=1 Tax=Chiayiivirga flava TaxID=659595 RepID=A0A7W8D8B2_9GAMM|nr:choice-of-anchor Q domain-containing protein [Chiayiivirga flava]MBB5208008.1 putative outer membrane repeat protein [Chiayiivirga flava]
MHPTPRRLLALALCCAPIAAQAQVFVRADAPAGGDGSSWASAYQRLDTALSAHPGDEIWVARGRYVPPVNPDPDYTPSEQRRRTSFVIPPGTRIYGGFAGTENVLAQRNLRLNRSVLSGDMQANDSNRDADGVTPTPDDIVGDNALHVVRFDAMLWNGGDGADIGPDTVLDGFVLSGGYASEDLYEAGGGGAVCIAGFDPGNVERCSPTLRNLEFVGNLAGDGTGTGGGGALAIYSGGAPAAPLVQNAVFRNNRSTSSGGAVLVTSVWVVPTPTFEDVEFIGNEAVSGGAVALTDFFDVRIDRARFTGNRARRNAPEDGDFNAHGGALYINGGFDFEDAFARLRVSNAVFFDNRAENLGGAVMNVSNGAATRVELVNSSFSANRARLGGVLFVPDVDGPVTQILNSVLWGNVATQAPEAFDAFATGAGDNIYGDLSEASRRVEIGHSLLQHGLNAPGVVYSQGYEAFPPTALVNLGGLASADPRFSGAELRLRSQSPAIDAGSNAYNTTALDRDGNVRVTGARIDMGAYEFIDNGCDGLPDGLFCDGFE